MTPGVVSAVTLSLQVAASATLLVMLIAVPIAYLLARREFAGKRVVAALLVLPMVLPPTAVGYVLLALLGDRGWLGRDTLGFDLQVLYTWRAAILAAAVMAFPLVVRTAQVAFEGVELVTAAVERTFHEMTDEVFLQLHVGVGIGPRDLGFEHPELGEVAAGLGLLGAERRPEAVNLAEGHGRGLLIELSGLGEEGGVAEVVGLEQGGGSLAGGGGEDG